MKPNISVFCCAFIFLLSSFSPFVWAGPSRVATEKDPQGNWELIVDGNPYFIKGFVFSPVKIGEDPGEATMRDWMFYDDDGNEKNDVAYQTWLDRNHNHQKDNDEKVMGDFQILKEMGVNTLRFYHLPSQQPVLSDIYKTSPSMVKQFDHLPNKDLLRTLNDEYGIKVIVGNFLGSWTIGSGASWEEGTDYTNPVHRQKIKYSVKAMVLDHKDEAYVLFWGLGNENNIADWSNCNAKQNLELYVKFVNELAQMIHELDPNHPVAVIEGEDGFKSLKLYAQYGKDIDIIGYNTYRPEVSLQSFFQEIRRIWDKPVYLSEIGKSAYNGKSEQQEHQYQYIKGSWRTLVRASAPFSSEPLAIKGTGNAIGATFFDWLDRWYMDGSPNAHNGGRKIIPGTDQLIHEEWFGIMSMGDGSDSLMRQPRKAYDYLKDVWTQLDLTF